MKKFLTIILIGLISFNVNAQVSQIPKVPQSIVDSAQKHLKTGTAVVYKDAKEVLAYGVGKTEQAVDTLYKLLGKGYAQLSRGAAHTFEVLKTQQLVKSFHHLFYWILGIIIAIVLIRRFKQLTISNKANDWEMASLIGLVLLDGVLFYFNISNFMEMWTGFINPEYGVYMEILQYLQK